MLPMGFLNSVGIAQHVHRVLVMRSTPSPLVDLPSREIRKDLPLPDTASSWRRVYLDNFDLLEKFPREVLEMERGSLAPQFEGLRGAYDCVGMPRHTGKSVTRQPLAEVQGAVVDGIRGMAYPKGSKLVKYTVMSILFCQLTHCSQRQAQVICWGADLLHYFSQADAGISQWLLSSLSTIGMRCIWLCRMDFRLPMKSRVTCSDASTWRLWFLGGSYALKETRWTAGLEFLV